MMPDSYESLGWFFEDSFQPTLRPHGRFDAFIWNVWYGYEGDVGAPFGPEAMFIMPESELNDVDTWVHEFVEVAVSGLITEVLELRPFTNIPVYLPDERDGWCVVCFGHLLAALTTGQGGRDEEYNYCTMASDDVWPWAESCLSLIKSGRKMRLTLRLCRWYDRVRRLFVR